MIIEIDSNLIYVLLSFFAGLFCGVFYGFLTWHPDWREMK